MRRIVFLVAFIVFNSSSINADERFETIVLSEEFHSEGADAADIDGDGMIDIVSGPYWYAGPDFRSRHAYAEIKSYSIKGYSDHFFSFARDFNGDSRPDIFSIPIPGGAAVWYENPKGENEIWKKHVALGGVGNESPTLADIDGDGNDELICVQEGRYGFAKPDPSDPTKPWKFQPISDNRGYGRFTHGLGIGDVDGDGRMDLLEKDGWWEQQDSPNKPFVFHQMKFAESGGSQMFAYDFDGDGDNDVLSVQNAHAYGLCWFERRGNSADDIVFIKHKIFGNTSAENPHGLVISQMHSVALVDIDGDGVKDIVTGKRFWAHGGNDPGAQQLSVLYWLKTVRGKNGVDFIPRLIDRRVGVGTQLTTTDIDGNGHVDVIVGNKLGTFVALNRGKKSDEVRPNVDSLQIVGTPEFAGGVRSTDALSPKEEGATFVLPEGFEAQLFASEPQIAKPLNMAFDYRGRLWVTNTIEYPYPAPNDREPRDSIKILEDIDGDGRADKVTTFADKLNIPMGLYPYKDGVICFSIPNVLFLRDTDGDNVADERNILYGPFDTTRDTHGMINALKRGYDGWLYACHGFNNQSSVSGTDGNVVTMHSGNTFRMRLDGSRVEHFTFGQVNPFGMAFDPLGDQFTADCHTKPITLLLQGGFYPSFGRPHDGLGFVPSVMNHLHGSTAIGGIALEHGGAFPEIFQGNAFGGNVMTSRINRNSVQRDGGSVSAREESDFLISGDPWFRPVDLQFGPDGALYVADFYNKIIGHYEVPLDHPGRDRDRGRIWRIVYKPTELRRDKVPVRPEPTKPKLDELESVVAALSSPNLTARLLAADRIVDHFGNDAVATVRARFGNSEDAITQVHCLWVLHRLDDLKSSELSQAAKSDDAILRVHAMKMIAAADSTKTEFASLLERGLADSDRLVQRCAAIASSKHNFESLIEPLLLILDRSPASDKHLRHSLRLALRSHLKDPVNFAAATRGAMKARIPTIMDLCLAIRTRASGEFVAKHIVHTIDFEREKLAEYLSFAARYANLADINSIVSLGEKRFEDDIALQEKLIRSIRSGLQQRGAKMPYPVRQWAIRLVKKRLQMQDDMRLPDIDPAIGWNEFPHPDAKQKGAAWTLSTRRSSADGQKNSRLHSSFPNGERKTGIYRSQRFYMPNEFTFYLAGHDGFPDKPIQKKNMVRIHEAKTHAVLKSWSPPRNDTAQRMTWKTVEFANRPVYVEMIDGDTANAFAWLAAGRFSVRGLNPNDYAEEISQAASMISEFRLKEFRDAITTLLAHSNTGRQTKSVLAKSLVTLSPSYSAAAAAESLSIRGLSADVRRELLKSLIDGTTDQQRKNVGEATKIATAAGQQRIAEALIGDSAGIEWLLEFIKLGQASPRLLVTPMIQTKLQTLANDSQKAAFDRITKSLPDENTETLSVIKARKQSYLTSPGNTDSGAAVFKKTCALCHKVADQGTEVGPNLDGIANRGLDRLMEDVFLPNRNIDVAFRASLVLTEDGQVLTGLLKPTEGKQIILIDQSGKEHRISAEEITQQKEIPNSPMPANFHETLDDQKTRDLLAYLLSLTK